MINNELIETKIGEILEKGIGLDWKNNPHLKETPRRVAKVYSEIYNGYDDDPTQHLKLFPAPQTDLEIIAITKIQTYSMCSHHMLPFRMEINIGYIPDKTILGISKFERIAKHFSHKLQVQENITEEIADFLYTHLQPKGVMVVIKNSGHLCMEMRGVETRNTSVSTSAVRGVFKNQEVKNEFLSMI